METAIDLRLELLETEINCAKVDLKAINDELMIAYKYEEEVKSRLDYARKRTEELQTTYFRKCAEISGKYDKMKDIILRSIESLKLNIE